MKQSLKFRTGAPRSPQRTWDENDGAKPLRTLSLEARRVGVATAVKTANALLRITRVSETACAIAAFA
jgi:hypothetical protein